MVKSLNKLFVLFMVFILIFSTFGCNDEKEEQVSWKEAVSELKDASRVDFCCVGELMDYVNFNSEIATKYYYVPLINCEDKAINSGEEYSFLTTKDGKEYIYSNAQVLSRILDNPNIQNVKSEDLVIARSLTFSFSSISYGITNYIKAEDLEFEHYISEMTAPYREEEFEKIIYVYNKGELILKYMYFPYEDVSEEQFEDYLRKNFICLGGNSGIKEYDNKLIISEALAEFTSSKTKKTVNSTTEMEEYLGANELMGEQVFLSLSHPINSGEAPNITYTYKSGEGEAKYLVTSSSYYDCIPYFPFLSGMRYDVEIKLFDYQLYSYSFNENGCPLTYRYYFTENERIIIILISQGDSAVAKFIYYKAFPIDGNYVIEFLKQNLIVIGGNQNDN